MEGPLKTQKDRLTRTIDINIDNQESSRPKDRLELAQQSAVPRRDERVRKTSIYELYTDATTTTTVKGRFLCRRPCWIF